MEDHLWSPWRMEYVKRPKNNSKECILCNEIKDDSNLIIHKTDELFVIMNLYPYNNGHIMVCPIKHISNFDRLNPNIQTDMMLFVTKIIKFMKTEMSAEGFNIGANIGKAAGAGIHNHFHMHVVPRWVGDTNFMPIIGKTKVQISTLYETCEFLKKAFK